MRPKSEDLRERIVARRQNGDSAADISLLFGVSIRSVQRYYRRFLDHGSVKAYKNGKPKGSKLDAHREQISRWIEQSPGITLNELCQRCEEQLGQSVHHTTMLRVLRAWGYRYKKNDIRQRTQSHGCD